MCAVNWLPNLNPRPVSVHKRLIQTASKRAMHRKLEGREATQCGEGLLLVSSWTSTVLSLIKGRTYCIFPRNHSHQPLWSFSGKERWKVSEAESSTALHPTTCLLLVHRAKPVSHMLILPTSNSWPVHTEAGGRILPRESPTDLGLHSKIWNHLPCSGKWHGPSYISDKYFDHKCHVTPSVLSF